MKFKDFDFEVKHPIYFIDIHDCCDNDEIIVLDFSLISDFEEERKDYRHQMIFSNKDMLSSVLAIFFGFNNQEINDILNDIKEDK